MVEVRNLVKIYKRHRSVHGFKKILKDLFKREYEKIRALDGISFEVEEGEILGYIGPNGAGKTTTLKILAGILYPTSGKVRIMGYTPWERKPDFLRKITFIMGQKTQLWWDLSSYDSFKLNQKIYEIPEKDFKERVFMFAELLRVKELLDVPLRNLSLGERMKMEIIGSLIHFPTLILLDEPTIGLDVVSQEDIREFFKHYRDIRKATIIVTSHYTRDIESICDRIIIIHKGRIVCDTSPDEITAKFSKYKIVNAVFGDTVPAEIYRFGKVLEKNEKRVKIRVDISKVHKIMQLMQEKYKLERFELLNPSLEEVLLDLYKKILNK